MGRAEQAEVLLQLAGGAGPVAACSWSRNLRVASPAVTTSYQGWVLHQEAARCAVRSHASMVARGVSVGR